MPYLLLSLAIFVSINCHTELDFKIKQASDKNAYISEPGQRFSIPTGFNRKEYKTNSFDYYLSHLPLKEEGAFVQYYDGTLKANHGVYSAVIDLSIGTKNLQQCADAVIRLRAEYLFAQKRYAEIHFNFLSDGKPRYYEDFVKGDHSYERFWEYLEFIFSYANTGSLYDEMKPIRINQAKIGDVLIQKKQPYGHAVIIVDMIQNANGKKLFMLAQSYMPAQEIHILTNKFEPSKGVWFDLDKAEIHTPEWTFQKEHLKRF